MFTPNEIQSVFYKAMLDGYANNSRPDVIDELPSASIIRYGSGLWEVADVWHTSSSSDKSFGDTIVYYDNNAIWMMQYRGEYSKAEGVIPFLKKALLWEYSLRVKHGSQLI